MFHTTKFNTISHNIFITSDCTGGGIFSVKHFFNALETQVK